ncbi:class I SAM-dependent methyltransferase [Microbacterium sp. K24]|uniref:class I SAM-dependent methyltransferase n=1 Tax=Microbacterium sp. K24 TaxID=2305446 RepID=UPI001F0D3899|nr:class I SAM-dependent methyltransferase [Microbacterium sp. K24]
MRDPRHFEALADEYAAARPPYPSALWDAVRELGVLRPGRRALDLGAGTGQATGPLLAAGLEVTAVEPGPRLAEQLRMRHPEATVVVDRAEDVELPPASFDLAVVATAIHWMDLGILLPKLRQALAADGYLLVWRTVFGDADAPVTAFREKVGEIVRDRRAPDRTDADPEDPAATAAALTAPRSLHHRRCHDFPVGHRARRGSGAPAVRHLQRLDAGRGRPCRVGRARPGWSRGRALLVVAPRAPADGCRDPPSRS